MSKPISVVSTLVLHCSDSVWGNAAEVDKWHRKQGWDSIGYHYVVNNGRPSFGYRKGPSLWDWDGKIEAGRAENLRGAHVEGLNAVSLGVCMIGKAGFFTPTQLTRAAALVAILQRRYPGAVVLGHYETPTGKQQGKTCPEFPMDAFRARLERPRDIEIVQAELESLGRGERPPKG